MELFFPAASTIGRHVQPTQSRPVRIIQPFRLREPPLVLPPLIFRHDALPLEVAKNAISEHPELAIVAAHQLGWTVIPPDLRDVRHGGTRNTHYYSGGCREDYVKSAHRVAGEGFETSSTENGPGASESIDLFPTPRPGAVPIHTAVGSCNV